MSYLYKPKISTGYNPIVTPSNSSLKYIEFGLIKLPKNKSILLNTKGRECVLILLNGKFRISCKGKDYSVGGRKDIFQERASGVHIPTENKVKITSEDNLLLAASFVPAEIKGDISVIRPGDNRERAVGKNNWSRKVYDIIDERVNSQRILAGETINPPGNWSSYPPHKHDKENSPYETKLEEVYYFRTFPKKGFGLQRLYDNAGLNEIYCVEDGQVVVIPKGYHPVVAAGGYSLYYLWILAGKNRKLCPFDDPAHKWVKER